MNLNYILKLGMEKIGANISFPKEEYNSLKKRLKKKSIYTTRVSEEKNKYKKNKIYKAPWGDKLKVLDIERYNKIKNHPFYNELTKDQIKTIDQYGDYELIKLTRR